MERAAHGVPARPGTIFDYEAGEDAVSSFGRGNTILSGVPSSDRTLPAPSCFSRSTTWETSSSGAEAPAVTPTRGLPAIQAGSICAAVSTR